MAAEETLWKKEETTISMMLYCCLACEGTLEMIEKIYVVIVVVDVSVHCRNFR